MTKWYDKEFEIRLPKLTQKQKRILWVVAAVALVLIALYVRYADTIDYYNYMNLLECHMHERVYLDGLDIRELEYEAFIEQYGEPERIEVQPGTQGNPDQYIARYQGISCTYVMVEYSPMVDPRTLPLLTQIAITDARYRFGGSKIGVGSTRTAVHRAYWSSEPLDSHLLEYCAEDFPAVEEGYFGDYWCRILFSYDENDCVDVMALQPYRS